MLRSRHRSSSRRTAFGRTRAVRPPATPCSRSRRRADRRRAVWIQQLTFALEGIDPEDYLRWARDPEPPALEGELLSIATASVDRGAVVTLRWASAPPQAEIAAGAAGFVLTPEVTHVLATSGRVHGR
jgi:hypothetical protein